MSGHSQWRNLLFPLIPVYRVALGLREACLATGREAVRSLRWPVVSVGNLSTGGAGKTPLTIALARALTRRGIHVDVLSRGYGRFGAAPARVDPDGTAAEFGDEPLLIAREAGVPVYVGAQRYEAGLVAEAEYKAGRSRCVHLLDDGFQHRQLHRDVDILLLTAQDLSDLLLPAGNLREPLKALRRATVLAVSAAEPEVEQYLSKVVILNRKSDRNFEGPRWEGPVWRVRRRMEIPTIAGRVIAFCGIARPQQFFEGLESAGLHLASRVAFADHHRYIPHDIDCLLDAARSIKATAFVTTEKDRVRLGSLAEKLAASTSLVTARLRIEIEDEAAAIDWLMRRLLPSPVKS